MKRTDLLALATVAAVVVGCEPASMPAAQPPQLKELRVGPPLHSPQPNSLGEYEVLPITAAIVKVAAPWPAELTVALNNVDIPRDYSDFHPGCTASCIGYWKVENIDVQPVPPVWDLYVHPSTSPGPGSKLTIDIRSKSANPAGPPLSAPLSLVLVAPPAAVPPPTPQPTAISNVSFRVPSGSPPATCQNELRWEWTPGANVAGGGIGTAVKVPSNQPFKSYTTAPVQITTSAGDPTWVCNYNDQAPGALSPGDWTIDVHRTSGPAASCPVTLAAGYNWAGFRIGASYCKLTQATSSVFGHFEYPP